MSTIYKSLISGKLASYHDPNFKSISPKKGGQRSVDPSGKSTFARVDGYSSGGDKKHIFLDLLKGAMNQKKNPPPR